MNIIIPTTWQIDKERGVILINLFGNIIVLPIPSEISKTENLVGRLIFQLEHGKCDNNDP